MRPFLATRRGEGFHPSNRSGHDPSTFHSPKSLLIMFLHTRLHKGRDPIPVLQEREQGAKRRGGSWEEATRLIPSRRWEEVGSGESWVGRRHECPCCEGEADSDGCKVGKHVASEVSNPKDEEAEEIVEFGRVFGGSYAFYEYMRGLEKKRYRAIAVRQLTRVVGLQERFEPGSFPSFVFPLTAIDSLLPFLRVPPPPSALFFPLSAPSPLSPHSFASKAAANLVLPQSSQLNDVPLLLLPQPTFNGPSCGRRNVLELWRGIQTPSWNERGVYGNASR